VANKSSNAVVHKTSDMNACRRALFRFKKSKEMPEISGVNKFEPDILRVWHFCVMDRIPFLQLIKL
jgi:hypothetical protein